MRGEAAGGDRQSGAGRAEGSTGQARLAGRGQACRGRQGRQLAGLGGAQTVSISKRFLPRSSRSHSRNSFDLMNQSTSEMGSTGPDHGTSFSSERSLSAADRGQGWRGSA
eukprot:COSAG04_NODE_10933_length_742_cov_3.186625_1_plen_109_part_10